MLTLLLTALIFGSRPRGAWAATARLVLTRAAQPDIAQGGCAAKLCWRVEQPRGNRHVHGL